MAAVPGTCELCDRETERLTAHHLVPKLKGGKNGPQARMCSTCHRQVHAMFTEGTLARHLNTVDALRADPKVQPYLSWVRKRAGGAQFNVRRWKGRF